ncbi:3'(2'),5'-bisphosphate nucleotidase CysQ [Phaeocystidibacter luteus]|uniref:3'(2'),5'-bisphosphate nucleotidase CysQ n=1 Tax=Phaeocystidibacter luteus TaxID=911197 RepID=A0A6N6RHK0_9FLAO|nr:3'(2'),5'-bisphosphate nucleotidase CysQ [Phaeocystidibacter luteus]KAB2813765.1 3'(2'),5'-bisphosphate nucleotidase CysQ [Phaeocystidibacter luteus]
MDKYTSAIHATLDGGKAILDVYHKEETIKVLEKEDKSPLTEADMAAHTAIMKWLDQTDIPVLSEEGKSIAFEERSAWGTLWVVDPLDGTKEFIKRNGEFTVNIALVENGVPVFGVIYVPVKHTLYFGGTAIGSFKVERISSDTQFDSMDELMTAATKLPGNTPKTFTVVGSRSHMNDDTKEYIDSLKEEHGDVEIMSKGSSLKICMVVEGEAHEYPRFAPTMEWDTAAGHALVLGVGKQMVIPSSGEPLQYNKRDLLNPYFLVK